MGWSGCNAFCRRIRIPVRQKDSFAHVQPLLGELVKAIACCGGAVVVAPLACHELSWFESLVGKPVNGTGMPLC